MKVTIYAKTEIEVDDKFKALEYISGVDFEDLVTDLDFLLRQKLPNNVKIQSVWDEENILNPVCLYEN